MKKILYTEELRQKHKEKYNEQKILAEIRREIDEKGFSIIEADEQIFFKIYYEYIKNDIEKYNKNDKNDKNNGFDIADFIINYFYALFFCYIGMLMIIIIIGFLSHIINNILLIEIDLFEIYSDFFITYSNFIVIIIAIILYKTGFRKRKKIDYSYISKRSKDLYYKYRNILVTEKRFFCGTKIIKTEKRDEIKKILFPKEEYFYEVENQKERDKIFSIFRKIEKISYAKIIKLKEYFAILDKISEEIGKTKIEISKNLENLELKNFKDLLEFLSQKIEETKTTREKIKKELENSTYKNYFDMAKYENYLKTSLLEPLIGIKEILERQIKYSDYLYEKTKNIDSVAVELSHKRLEMQKRAIQKQIILINEKIKKLEI